MGEDFLTMCSLLDSPPLEAVISNLNMDIKHDDIDLFKHSNTTTTEIDNDNNNIGGMDNAMKKLRESMRRTELSRLEILRQKNSTTKNDVNMQQTSSGCFVQQQQQQPPSLSHLNNFFTGKRKSLTSELEESRRKVRAIMSNVEKVNSIARMA